MEKEMIKELDLTPKNAAGLYHSPYDTDIEDHKFHAVVLKKHHNQPSFVSAKTGVDLSEALTRYDLGEILVIYEGKIRKFSEKRLVSIL